MKVLPGLRQLTEQLNHVPSSQPVLTQDLCKLEKFVSNANKLLVLTGAGFSTESGIPDYRSEKVGLYARTDRRPMNYQEFLSSPYARQKYWARNFVGWPNFSSHLPNIGHKVLHNWERQGKLTRLVTQNVDALHTRAGNQLVTELHGCLHRVLCLSCGEKSSRLDLQERFMDINPNWLSQEFGENHIAPDGDVNLSEDVVKTFKVPECLRCGGALKPDVIFFGDNVPKSTVEFIFHKVDISDSMLVMGSSLSVYSGYRFLVRAAEQRKNIAIVNIGPTRADHLAQLKIMARCGDILPKINIQIS